MRIWRNRRFAAVLLSIIWLTILLVCWHLLTNNEPEDNHEQLKELLWWSNSMSWDYDEKRDCGVYKCRFSNNRERLSHAHAVLFYGSNMKTHDFPLPRQADQVWALLHEESPRNVPFVPFIEFLQHFNYTSTFSRYSDLPLTTQYLPSSFDLTSMDYVHSYDYKKNSFPPIGSVVFLQSDCDTMTGREDYIKELMRHIQVDSFGSCLKNMDLPESLQKDYLNNIYSPDLLRFLARYKFMIAIENGVCNDYITEKYWRPLVVGVIPIYFGSPTIRDWQPRNKSAIYVEDFPNAAALAKYLEQITESQYEYDSYRFHKLNRKRKIDNSRLLENLITRQYSIGDSGSESSLFRKFECFMCRVSFWHMITKRAHKSHYNCPLPPVHVPLEHSGKEPKNAADWRAMFEVGHCQAKLLDNLFRANRKYTQREFEEQLMNGMNKKRC